nr:photosystem I assembly protein Ycf36 [Cryptomonas sp. NIES-3952]
MRNPCPVPKHQRPLTEFNELKNAFGFSWTLESPTSFFKTVLSFLIYIVLGVSLLVAMSFKWQSHIEEFIFWIILTSFFILAIWILRIYLAWIYIYDRLMNATVTYEESGWYDGQTWIKTNDILIQDRLVGVYEILPVLNRLKLILMLCAFVIISASYINLQINI